jgi:HD-GYP domain-containing protein (c-di-GMP phosphodiesterase class II)
MNQSAFRARNFRLGLQHPPNSRLSPEGRRRGLGGLVSSTSQVSILREQSHRYHNKLVLVNKLSHTLAEASNLPEMYDRLARSIFFLLPRVHFFYLYRADQLTERINCVYAAHELNSQPQPFDPAASVSPAGFEILQDVVRLRRPVVINDLVLRQGRRREAFHSIQSVLAAPMIHEGRVTGVLQILSKMRRRFGVIETDILSLVSNTTAVSLENMHLGSCMANTSNQLNIAYDSAVESWRRALELRDHATEGHGGRVAELTVRLAISLGYGSYDLSHMRFGAQLHDIGKIGVPDSVLLKPGPLDDEDKKIMYKHPVYAYELLSPIPNFAPILDIPYSHHERWDGGGYPCGLKGEQIPFAARIFAVIDVWDALNSDRPYRLAWPEKEVITYIRDQSGRHFDPQVVDAFLSMMVAPA